jgi:polyisoprenoid-binding protein YceI
MKKALLILGCIIGLLCQAQRVSTRSGQITFFSRATLSNIEAQNNTAVSVMDKNTGKIEFAVLMKGFEFEKSLMQEHFNDDYVESDKYPRSVFKGSILNLGNIDFSKNGTYTTTVAGDLTIHGITKPVTVQGQLQVDNGSVTAMSEFNIALSDFNIKIPALVSGDISNNIRININFKYQ